MEGCRAGAASDLFDLKTMKFRGLLLILPFLVSTPAIVSATPMSTLPEPIATSLGQAAVPESSIGVYVHDLTTDAPVLAVGADRPLNPASVMKLVTTLAALEILGPAHAWKTEAYLDGTLAGDRLEGNLVLKGYGDPKLTLEGFWLFLRDLRNRGLRDIAGDLVLDRSFFEVSNHDPAQFDNEPTRPYNVGPDPLLLNFKSFRLQFVPDDERRAVSVLSEPMLPQVTLVNNLYLAPGFCDIWPEKPAHDGNTLTFNGVFPSSCGEKSRDFSLLAPNEYMSAVFAQIWRQIGGSWSGSVRDAQVSASAKLFATRESAPLAEIVHDVNKFSNNVMARHLFLALGARDGGPATLDKSDRATRDWLTKRGLSFPELTIDNGAGLSRTARISARHLGELLAAAWKSPLMPEYVASLPLAAVDGTMRKRLNNSPVAGRAHIKTGYLDEVRANAGYVIDSHGHMLAVVFLVNHPAARHAQPALEAFLEWVQAGYTENCCGHR
jgi:D-alanyl-D-alanine carboxypeptidase/D-alanyl-D-alanine-endopeptidase (penicillin-binding protein 4)